MTARQLRIVPMREDQLERATAVMVRAFVDDPLFVAGYPDPAERERVVPLVAAWNFRHGRLFGEILVADDPPVGVTIAYRATRPAFSDERVAASIGDTRTRVGEAGFDRMQAPFATADAQLVATLPGPHWYLDMVAVEPACQGTGVGSALLTAVHELAGADGWPTGLVTFQPRNLPFYQRLGYERVGAGTEPTSSVEYWCFRRAPRSRRT